jgi:hypothetical protein
MENSQSLHPSDDQLDRYALGHLPFERQHFIESHFLVCTTCREALLDTTEFIAVLKAIAVYSPQLLCRYPTSAATRAQVDRSGWRTSFTRLAAMLLIGVGTAMLCSSPAQPLAKSLGG